MSELGEALENSGWQPGGVYLEQHALKDWNSDKVKLGYIWVLEHRADLQVHLCANGCVKPEVADAGKTAAIIADHLQGMSGLPIPVWQIANTICILGVDRFCGWHSD